MVCFQVIQLIKSFATSVNSLICSLSSAENGKFIKILLAQKSVLLKFDLKNWSWTQFWAPKSMLGSILSSKTVFWPNFELTNLSLTQYWYQNWMQLWVLNSKLSQKTTKLITLWHVLTNLETIDEVWKFHRIFLPQWIFAANYPKQFALDELQSILSVDRVFIDEHRRQLSLLFFGLNLKTRYKIYT